MNGLAKQLLTAAPRPARTVTFCLMNVCARLLDPVCRHEFRGRSQPLELARGLVDDLARLRDLFVERRKARARRLDSVTRDAASCAAS